MKRWFRRLLFPLLLLIIQAVPLYAADAIVARNDEVSLDSQYVTVNLDRLANDAQALAAPQAGVKVDAIPFQLVQKAGSGNLFLKPIGWSAAKDESNEYPGYIAKYDTYDLAVKEPSRALVRVPVSDYTALWLLAATDNDRALSDIVSFRLGIADGQGRKTYHDFTARIPRADGTLPATGTTTATVAKTFDGAGGKVYLVRVPLGKVIAQDFKERRALDLDITKELRTAINLPDPNRFQIRPLGPPSGVRIYGLTMERAGLAMEATPLEPGGVFNQPQVPGYRLDFQNTAADNSKYKLQAIVTRDDGAGETFDLGDLAYVYSRSYANPAMKRVVQLPVKERGHYKLSLNVLLGGQVVLYRQTTFALLAPDTRKYRHESPFGTWDFGGVHFTPNDADLLGPLYVKLGLRYGMASSLFNESIRKKWGIENGSDPRLAGEKAALEYLEYVKKDPNVYPQPNRILTFHESSISGVHLTRTPDMFTGRPPYKMNEAEQKQFQAMLKEAEETYKAGKKVFPQAENYFGNTVPHVPEEFFRAKFPRTLLDKLGNESGSFMRLPEQQPLDFVGNNSGLWMFRQIADHYGYIDLELRQCLEVCYPNSNPGNLKESTQAKYLVRHAMHSLAWRIPVFRPACITDMGNSYYDSNWGASGFCSSGPNISPKPAYVAFATMTQAVDGAKYVRNIPTGSTVVYAEEFQKKDKSYVTCLWTLRGARTIVVEAPGSSKETLIGSMGRETPVEFKDRRVSFEVSNAPVYLTTRRAIASIQPGAAKMETRPEGKPVLVSALDKADEWTVETGNNTELEVYNFMNPRRKGDFAYRWGAAIDGESNAVEVTTKLPVPGSQYLQMYPVLSHNKGVEIAGEPTEIGLMVNGNGGWGRIIFELEDAGGQRWISIGAEQAGAPNPWMADWMPAEEFKKLKASNLSDWNSDDAWGRSVINFDGWRFLKIQLPGNYPGENYPWPRNSQWRFSGDGVVKYPLKLKKLVVTMPEKVLYGTEYISAPRKSIYLKDIIASYEPVEKVFSGE